MLNNNEIKGAMKIQIIRNFRRESGERRTGDSGLLRRRRKSR